MANELKPRPCCGSTDVGGSSGVVVCYKCRMATERMKDTDVAARVWNNRPAESKIKADAVREALAYAQTQCGWRTTTHYRVAEFSCAVEDYANKLRERGE